MGYRKPFLLLTFFGLTTVISVHAQKGSSVIPSYVCTLDQLQDQLVVRNKVSMRTDSSKTSTTVYRNEYDDMGSLVKRERIDQATGRTFIYEYTYDKKTRHPVKRIDSYTWRGKEGVNGKTKFVYKNGLQQSKTFVSEKSKSTSSTSITYDEKNRPVVVEMTGLEQVFRYRYYLEKGYYIRERSSNGQVETRDTLFLDDKLRVTREVITFMVSPSKGSRHIHEFQYDGRGNQIVDKYYQGEELSSVTTRTFYDNGLLRSEKVDDKSSPSMSSAYSYAYEYY